MAELKSGEWELSELTDAFRAAGVRRFLEIGSRKGQFFSHVMRGLPDAFGVAVDLPNAAWGRAGSDVELREVVRGFKGRAIAIFGDSHDEAVREKIRAHGPFDACLIDADHRYEPARMDWLFARDIARVVAFHDIDFANGAKPPATHRVEVPRLWAEIKDDYRHQEIIGPKRGFGFGVIYQAPRTLP